MFIFSAAGILGNPGIVIIFPANATINPAPFFNCISFICILKRFLHSKFLLSSEKEYCVFAIHIGNLSHFNFSILFIFSSALLEYSTLSAP